MEVKKVWSFYFSPAGTTQKTVCTIAEELANQLSADYEQISFTKFAERSKTYCFGDGDLVVVGTPTYAGKIPNKIMPDFKENLQGNGALAVAVATYGNRAFENSLAELYSILDTNGFHTIAAAAVVCEHSIGRDLATGRPNADDLFEFKVFSEKIAEKLRSNNTLPVQDVPGNADAPYYIPLDEEEKPAKFLKAKPKTDLSKCVKCGICSANCPMEAIDSKDFSEITGICIKCQSCIHKCPKQAKYFDDPVFASHVRYVVKTYQDRKENEFFL